jgi:hypothetical protein
MSVHLGSDLSRTATLCRLPCLTCKEETIHRASKCIHCGRLHAPVDHVRQVKLDTLNVYRLGVTRSPTQLKRLGAKRGRPRKVVA